MLPLNEVQVLDPDLFKLALPEWEGYCQRDALKAGVHTRRESGYLVEIAQEAAMRENLHVWVDGSLRDGEWYAKEFARLRREHPAYRIAILHVVANREVVLERVEARARVTGRHVPLAEIDDALVRVPRSVAALAPLADFMAVVDNSARSGVPRLSAYCDAEVCMPCSSDEWTQLSGRLSTRDEASEVAEECDVDPDGSWDRVSSNFDGQADGGSFLFDQRG